MEVHITKKSFVYNKLLAPHYIQMKCNKCGHVILLSEADVWERSRVKLLGGNYTKPL